MALRVEIREPVNIVYHEKQCSGCGKYRVLEGPLNPSGKDKAFYCDQAYLRCDVPELVSNQARKWLISPEIPLQQPAESEKWTKCTKCSKWRWIVLSGVVSKDWSCERIPGLSCEIPTPFPSEKQVDALLLHLDGKDDGFDNIPKKVFSPKLVIRSPRSSPSSGSLSGEFQKKEVLENGKESPKITIPLPGKRSAEEERLSGYPLPNGGECKKSTHEESFIGENDGIRALVMAAEFVEPDVEEEILEVGEVGKILQAEAIDAAIVAAAAVKLQEMPFSRLLRTQSVIV